MDNNVVDGLKFFVPGAFIKEQFDKLAVDLKNEINGLNKEIAECENSSIESVRARARNLTFDKKRVEDNASRALVASRFVNLEKVYMLNNDELRLLVDRPQQLIEY